MRKILLNAILLAMLVPAITMAQGTGPRTMIFTSHYGVDIEYNNVLKWFGGSVLGMAPKALTYREIVVTDSGKEKGFHLELAENPKTQWVVVDADTTVHSFTHFPRSDEKDLGRDAAALVERLLGFLQCQDSCNSVLVGSLHVGGEKILVTLTVRDYIVIPDSQNIALRGDSTRYADAFTRDARSEAPYISGNVVMERINGHTIYPYVSAYLFKENVRIKLYLRDFSEEYK